MLDEHQKWSNFPTWLSNLASVAESFNTRCSPSKILPLWQEEEGLEGPELDFKYLHAFSYSTFKPRSMTLWSTTFAVMSFCFKKWICHQMLLCQPSDLHVDHLSWFHTQTPSHPQHTHTFFFSPTPDVSTICATIQISWAFLNQLNYI